MKNIFLERDAEILSTTRNLPHMHQDGKLQFVTFHLADSLPQSILTDMQQEKKIWLKAHPEPWTENDAETYHHRFCQFVDRWLDNAHGSCILTDTTVACIVENALKCFDGMRYLLHSYVVMPNHVHVLVEMKDGVKLTEVMHNWKSFTAHAINKKLGKKGALWRKESFDRIIRDEIHYMNVRNYILKNIKQGGVRWMI